MGIIRKKSSEFRLFSALLYFTATVLVTAYSLNIIGHSEAKPRI